jgi:hypothetical protein
MYRCGVQLVLDSLLLYAQTVSSMEVPFATDLCVLLFEIDNAYRRVADICGDVMNALFRYWSTAQVAVIPSRAGSEEGVAGGIDINHRLLEEGHLQQASLQQPSASAAS